MKTKGPPRSFLIVTLLATGCAASAGEDGGENGLAVAAPDADERAARALDAKTYSDLVGLEITTRGELSVAKGTERSYWPGRRSDYYELPFDAKLKGQCYVEVVESNPEPVRYTVPAGTSYRIRSVRVRAFSASVAIDLAPVGSYGGNANVRIGCNFYREALLIPGDQNPFEGNRRAYVATVTMLRAWAFEVEENPRELPQRRGNGA